MTGSDEVQSQGVRAEGAPGPGSGGPDPPQVLRQGAGGRPPREHPSVPGGTTLPAPPRGHGDLTETLGWLLGPHMTNTTHATHNK